MSLRLLRRWAERSRNLSKKRRDGDMIMADKDLSENEDHVECVCFFLNVKQTASGWTRNTTVYRSQEFHASYTVIDLVKSSQREKWRTRALKNSPSEEFLLSQGSYTKVKIMWELEKYTCKERWAISAIFMWLKKWILTRVGHGLSLKYVGKKNRLKSCLD